MSLTRPMKAALQTVLRKREDELRVNMNKHLSGTPHKIGAGAFCEACSRLDGAIAEIVYLRKAHKPEAKAK